MPQWLDAWLPPDPLVRLFITGGAGLVLLALVARGWQRRREASASARRAAELRKSYGSLQVQQQEISRLAAHILATSSTGTIAGFEIVRQIEAVFAEGQRSPAAAVDMLKALGAQRGANALINVKGQRLPDGKCTASGDAVVVRPIAQAESPGPVPPRTLPELPADRTPEPGAQP